MGWPRTVRGTVFALAAVVSAIPAFAQTITEFSVPTADSNPVDITAGPDGNLWFTGNLVGTIGRVTPAGTITEFLNDPNAGPAGITVGPDGNLWYADEYANEIGRVTTSGAVTRFPVGGTDIYPAGIAVGSDGNLWFAEYGPEPSPGSIFSTGGKIGRITTSGVVTQFALPTGVAPVLIRAGPDGNLWFTDPGTNTIGRMTTAGVLTSFTVPTPGGAPVGLTVGPDNALWFTEANGHKVGRITTAGAFTEFPVQTSGMSPLGITKGPDGNLWFTDNANNTIGRMTTSGAVTMFPIPTAGSGPVQICQGPDGNLWFTEVSTNKIGKVSLSGGACTPDATTACLNGGRFETKQAWMTPDGQSGPGMAVPLTGDTAYFWYFSSNNVESVVKVVDGCGFNSREWVFAGGLTNVNVVTTVRDTQTGAVRSYTNPQGTAFQPLQDTSAFACATAPGEESRVRSPKPTVERMQSRTGGSGFDPGPSTPGLRPASPNACAADGTTLCLNDSRFQVRVQWSTTDGRSGDGQAVPLTADTGYFWFFSSNNVEMVLKVVSGCGFNERFWVFAGGLTNVAVAITVIDTLSGAVMTYNNPQGTAFQPIQDTSAFVCQREL